MLADLKHRNIYIVIFIISVVGLFVVQYQYLLIGLKLVEVQFDQKVARAAKDLKNDLSTENQLSFLIAQSLVSSNYFTLSKDSLQDASEHFLNDFIKDRLLSNRINTKFSYRLISRDSSFSLTSPTPLDIEDASKKFPIELNGYLPDAVQKNLTLELQFQNLTPYFLSQLKGLLIPGFLFLTMIILVVIWMLRLFTWQRNLIVVINNFINNLTHELKTPVFSIGVATKILEKDLSENQKPIVVQIRKQVDRLNKHIEQVLELSSLETKNKYIELKEVDLRPHLLEWCADFKILSETENFQFNYEVEPQEFKVKVALSHFGNAVNNLLDNARKYADEPEINLSAFTREKKLHIMISDNGRGIPESEKQLVFKKFYRVSEGNLHSVKGFGLGLSYVEEVVKLHNGSILLESELQKGTKITLIIPLKR